MISWIQRTFQHHFRLIFGVLLAVTIISFIFTIGSTPGVAGGDRQTVTRKFFGVDINSGTEMRRPMSDAALSVSLQVGYMALDNESLQKYTLQRIAALHLADEYHIPAPTQAELTTTIKSMRAFAGADGQFDATRYAAVRDSFKTSAGMSEGEVLRVLNDDWRAARVQDLLGGPGYVLPADVRNNLVEADTSWTVAVATTDYAGFAPEIKPTEAELTKFFQENTFRYDIPPRVVAGYLDFPAADQLAKVKVTEEEVKAYYDSNPARFPKPASAAPAAGINMTLDTKSDPAADFAVVRPQVEAALKLEKAKREAQRAASDVALKLYDTKTTAETIAPFLATNKLTLKPLAPFTKEDGPAELGKSPEIADAAFALSAKSTISDALAAPNGAVVLVWKETQTVRTPAYAEVKDKVSTDYTENEKRKRFSELGKSAKATIEARLKAGDDFEKAVAAAATATSVKFEQKAYPPFTLRAPAPDLPPVAMNAVGQMVSAKGQVSDMVVSGDKGYVLYAIDKKLPDISETSAAFASTRNQVASSIASYNGRSYIQRIMGDELKRTEPAAAQ